MADATDSPRIAIACQGGGSHTAFTAGVLRGLLEKSDAFKVVALSGTSGGAICALLAWDGLLRGDRRRAIDQLVRFWRENTACSLLDAFLNYSIQMAIHLRSLGTLPDISPYAYPSWSQQQLRRMLERRIDFAEARSLAQQEGAPELIVGAVDVLGGKLEVFRGSGISVESLLASAAVPDLFPAVKIDGRVYWDGLYSQNPPIRDLTDHQPDEVWVIQINRTARDRLPRTMDDIHDRRNELAGNLSLEHELRFVEKINDLLRRGMLVNSPYRPITVHRIVMEKDLDYASKFDRSESLIRDLMGYGTERARQFFGERGSHARRHPAGARPIAPGPGRG
jgi:NTE family protein